MTVSAHDAPVPDAPHLPASIQLSIEYLPITVLIAEGRKLKLHKASDITALARAIEVFGFLVPVLIDQDCSASAPLAQIWGCG